MSASLEADPLNKIKTRLINNRSHEGHLLAGEKIQLERWGGRGNNVGVFTAPSLHAYNGKLFYRTMKKQEFDTLYGNGILAPPGYGGITDSREYTQKYLTVSGVAVKDEDSGTHTVEFYVRAPVDLEAELKYLGLTAKAESGAMSYGLGPAQKNGVGAEYFNTLLSSRVATWRLVAFLENVSGKR
jgi:hypothetical protein